MIIFDLDGTTIDSRHRHATRPDGSLDLAHWRENSTPEKIAQDKLLPLAYYWQNLRRHTRVVVCTARVMSEADWAFLRTHRLKFWAAFSRQEGDYRPDAELKYRVLRHLHGLTKWVMFDDNDSVRERISSLGITCYHPREWK